MAGTGPADHGGAVRKRLSAGGGQRGDGSRPASGGKFCGGPAAGVERSADTIEIMDTSPLISDTEIFAKAAAMQSPWRIFWGRLRRQRLALAGGCILAFLYTVAFFAGFIAPYGYERQDRDRFFHRPTALRFSGGHLAVQGYEPVPDTSKFQPAKGDLGQIHFFV